MNDKHALFANTVDHLGNALTFRVGQPVDWTTAIHRWDRLDSRRGGFNVPKRAVIVRWARRKYRVTSFEVRAVDANGRGLGSERHAAAFPVPYRLCRSSR